MKSASPPRHGLPAALAGRTQKLSEPTGEQARRADDAARLGLVPSGASIQSMQEQKATVAALAQAVNEAGLRVLRATDQRECTQNLGHLYVTTRRLLVVLCASKRIAVHKDKTLHSLLSEYMEEHPWQPGDMLEVMGDALEALDHEHHAAGDAKHLTPEQAEKVGRRVMSMLSFLSGPDTWLMYYARVHDAVTAAMFGDYDQYGTSDGGTSVPDHGAPRSDSVHRTAKSETQEPGRAFGVGLGVFGLLGLLMIYGSSLKRGLAPGCAKDTDCTSAFCDRGKCASAAEKTEESHYGDECSDPKECDGFCVEGRCRSCLDDDECRQKNGEPNWCYQSSWRSGFYCSSTYPGEGLM